MQGKKPLWVMAMDSLQPTVTTGTVGTPVQFLQNWLPGFVFVITAARKIDDIIGLMVTGAWEDEQIVQGILDCMVFLLSMAKKLLYKCTVIKLEY